MSELIRPEKIFLDIPLTIEGFTINYTHDGLDYMIDHYQQVQNTEAHSKQSHEVREHLIQVLSRLNYLKFLYTKTITQSHV